MNATTLISAMLVSLLWSTPTVANEAPMWVTQGPYVDESSFQFELPIEVVATKIFVDVELGGATRRFVFDTGSPSMMSAALAEELELKVVDKTQGRDAHGAVVNTNIVQADLTLGGTTFRKVPIFVAEFPATAKCLFDGVIGSELLPLCAWQIDLPDSKLRCNTDLRALDHVGKAGKQVLHDFGYPHAPILDVRFGKKASSKAMFDTGSPDYMAIAPADLDGAKRNGDAGKSLAGHGSSGASLGGRALDTAQQLVQLKSLSIGSLELGRVDAVLRESVPSLLGASILEHFVVTLDSRTKSAYFDAYQGEPYSRPSFGFSLDFEGAVTVSRVWDDSPATAAGMQVGQRIASINGEVADTSCASIRRVMREISESDTITLELGSGKQTLQRANLLQ